MQAVLFLLYGLYQRGLLFLHSLEQRIHALQQGIDILQVAALCFKALNSIVEFLHIVHLRLSSSISLIFFVLLFSMAANEL